MVRRVERAETSEKTSPSAARPGQTTRGHDPGPLLAEAYPDRIAQSRGGGRYRLRQVGGAVLPNHDPLATVGWLVAANVEAPTGGIGRADGQIRLAAVLAQVDVERIGAKHVRTVVRLEWDEQLDDLWATTERVLDALVLDVVRGPAPPGPDTTTALVAHAVKTGLTLLGLTPIARSFQARVGWARRALGEDWPDLSDAALGARANEWLEPLRRGRAGDLIWPV